MTVFTLKPIFCNAIERCYFYDGRLRCFHVVSSFRPLNFQLVSDFFGIFLGSRQFDAVLGERILIQFIHEIHKNFPQVLHKLTEILSFRKRFSQNFIDIREKERKRGARGLVTVPTKVELMGNETSADNSTTLSPEEQTKAEDMLKLQQKITQELLNSNLKESERNELQVRRQTSKSTTATNCANLR